MVHMIEDMSFKCRFDVVWTVLPRDVFRNPIKFYDGAFFAKIVNDS